MAIGENNKHDCKISNSVKRIFNNICVVSDCCAISSSKMKNSLTQINYTYLQMKKPKIGKHKGFYNSLFDEINEKSGKVRFKNFRSRNRKDQAQESSSKFRENTISCLQHFYSFQNIGIWDLKTRNVGSTTACSEIKQLDKEEIHSKLYRVMNNGAICKKNTTIKILKPKFSGYASNFWRANNNSQKKPEPANDFEIEKVLFAKTELSSKDSTQQSNSVISESRIYTIQKAKVYKKTLECDNGLQFDYKYRNYQYSNSLINERRFLNNSEGYASNFWRANNNSQKKPEPANDFEIEKVLFAKTELSSKDSTQQSNSVISESRIYTIQKAKVYKKTLECDNGLQFDYKYRNYQYSNSLINERRFLNNSEGSARSFWKLLETGDDYKMEKILFAKNELSSKNICQQSTTFDNSSEIKNRGINTIQKKVSIKKVEECGSELQFLNKFPNYQHNNSLLKERCFLNKYESLISLLKIMSASSNKICTGSLCNISEIFITITTGSALF
ncbi:uncharacterized protein LOC105220101 isoform X15 [Zeugodacus cucurbitae]|uniref:uncharacterized protein LOC105220101 isoform X15 n=1 Tax=Zeugodacus cucurbitae TaxID=28588 RepID=UPI0023D943A3|nr:uncharacterized protein LOC105220101 isoform X15 [Zeugodacus cucurbitae]